MRERVHCIVRFVRGDVAAAAQTVDIDRKKTNWRNNNTKYLYTFADYRIPISTPVAINAIES